jgi:hypothetical protein
LTALVLDERSRRVDFSLPGHIETHGLDVVDGVQRIDVLLLARAGIDVKALRRECLGQVAADPGTGAGYQDGFLALGGEREGADHGQECNNSKASERNSHVGSSDLT